MKKNRRKQELPAGADRYGSELSRPDVAYTDVAYTDVAYTEGLHQDRIRPEASRTDSSRSDTSRPYPSRSDRSQPERSQPERSRLERSRPEEGRPQLLAAGNRRKLVGSAVHPVSPVPLRGVATLGRARGQEAFALTELKPSAIMPPQESIPDFDQIPYRKWEQAQVRTKIRNYYGDVKRAKTAEEAMEALKKINQVWTGFQDSYHLARLRRLEVGSRRAFYEEEHQRASQAWPILEKTVFRISGEVLDRAWLSELTSLQGKLILLRINAHYTLGQLGSQDLRKQERSMAKDLKEQLKGFPAALATAKNLRQPDILMDELFRIRHELAPRLGFDSFRDYAWICQEYFDYDRAKLVALRDGMKRYLLPIHQFLEKALQEHLPQAETVEQLNNPRRRESQNLAERFAGFRDYYERVMAEDDWELRHIEDYIPEEETHRSVTEFPASPLFVVQRDPEAFFDLVVKVVDQSLSRPNRGFLRQLGQKGYLRLDFRKVPAALETNALSSSPCPVLSGTYYPNSHFVSDFLHAVGELYADLLGKNRHPELAKGGPLAEESCAFIGYGMEMMCLPYMDHLFGEESQTYQHQKISQSLITLLKACLIDEFEEAVYSQEALSMSDRNELWDHLRETYGLTLYTEAKFWADPLCAANLLDHPFAALIRVLPLFESLVLWDQNRQKKKVARSAYESFCSLGASDTFLEQLGQAGLPDPFAPDTLKRLAYQLASFLETTA